VTFGQLVALAATWVAAVTDWKHGKIFNWCTYSACGWGLAIALLGAADDRLRQGLGALGPEASLAGLSACLFAMLLVHSLTGGGMGDVKLAAALGCLVGVDIGFQAILLTFVSAGVVILGLSLVRHGLGTTVLAFAKTYARCFLPLALSPDLRPTEHALLERRIRLGPFFAVGTSLVLLNSWTRVFTPVTPFSIGLHP
jgi:Flp pilus assembly protein protease CpaA